PTTTTIVGDLYEAAERGRIQGYISSVWGVSAIVGPALGGFFAEYWTWRGVADRPAPARARGAAPPPDRRRRRTDVDGRLLAPDPRPARGRRQLGLGV